MTEKEAECLIDGLNVLIDGLRDILNLKVENKKLKEKLSTVEAERDKYWQNIITEQHQLVDECKSKLEKENEELKDQNRKLTNGVNYWIEKYKNEKEENKKLQTEINELKTCERCVHFGKKFYENDPFKCPYVGLCSNKDRWTGKQ